MAKKEIAAPKALEYHSFKSLSVLQRSFTDPDREIKKILDKQTSKRVQMPIAQKTTVFVLKSVTRKICNYKEN